MLGAKWCRPAHLPSTMPSAFSSSRMRSAAAKSRFFLASARSAMRASIAPAVAHRPGTSASAEPSSRPSNARRLALTAAGSSSGHQPRSARAGVLRSSPSASTTPLVDRRPAPASPACAIQAGRGWPSPARSTSSVQLQRLAIMRRQQRQPQRLALMPLRQQLARRDDVAEALRHLLGAHVDEAVVHPEARERRAGVGAAALRDLILVVREDEVEPAAVDVDRLAEMGARSSPSIRCASRAGRGPTGCPSRSRPSALGFHSTKSAGSRL